MKQLIFFCSGVILLLAFNSCLLFKKKISKQVTIAVADTTFVPVIKPAVPNIKYTSYITSGQVMHHFLKGFKQEAKYTSNVTLKFDTTGVDFILRFRSFQVDEQNRIKKIEDPKSLYNGKQAIYNCVTVMADLEIIDTKNRSMKLMNCGNSKERTEAASSDSDLAGLILVPDADYSQYKTRLMRDSVALTLSEDVGHRVWVPITRRISKITK